MNPHTFPSRVGRSNPLASSTGNNWHSTHHTHTHTNLRVLFFNATFLTLPKPGFNYHKSLYLYVQHIPML